MQLLIKDKDDIKAVEITQFFSFQVDGLKSILPLAVEIKVFQRSNSNGYSGLLWLLHCLHSRTLAGTFNWLFTNLVWLNKLLKHKVTVSSCVYSCDSISIVVLLSSRNRVVLWSWDMSTGATRQRRRDANTRLHEPRSLRNVFLISVSRKA